MHRSSARPSLQHEVWEALGTDDPDWAVLTDPGRRHGGWDDHREEFYASGRSEVADVLASLPELSGTQRAMDWGSGTGRLTFALLETYDQVTAVDVSRSMLSTLVDRAHQFGLAGRIRPVLVPDLRPDGQHDLALSLLVLQHAADEAEALRALSAMTASLRIGGCLVVEIPAHALTMSARLQPRYRAYRAARMMGFLPATLHRRGLSGISMLCVPEALVRHTLESAGAQIVAVNRWRDSAHEYARYVARRTR
jgi:trans-aconitate methyltransferase